MPFVSGAPESLIPRSDSKNPATTCKGITSNGRPCRRSLATARTSARTSSQNGGQGVLAFVPSVGEHHEGAAAYFCWQHKDQAATLATQASTSQVLELKERNSIDTLVNRLGVVEVGDKKKRAGGQNSTGKPAQVSSIRQDTLPEQWQRVSGPLMTVPEAALEFQSSQDTPRPPKTTPKKQRRRNEIQLSFFCCMRRQSSDSLPPARPRPSPRPQMSQAEYESPNRPPLSPYNQHDDPNPTPSQTSRFLSFIPQSFSPALTSTLLTELAKPLTLSDREPGYIYIFWLTPSIVPQTAANTASSLLTPPRNEHRAGNARRASDVLRDFAHTNATPANNEARGSRGVNAKGPREKTIFLKIGRASNVHRRMNEWTRQCGENITLLRYYPNEIRNSPSPSPSPSPSSRLSPRASPRRSTSSNNVPNANDSPQAPQKAPLVPRVERLIHLELQDKRVKRLCDGCGKEHREWFEVEASRDGIKSVNDCIMRWVRWATQEVEREQQ